MIKLYSPTNKTISLLSIFIITSVAITSFYLSSFTLNEASALSDYQKDDLECLNLNVNVNGLNFTALPEPLRNLLESQAETEYSDVGSTSGNNDKNGLEYEKDFAFICKNFNENEVIIPPTPTPQPTENNVYVVWQESITPDNAEIFFAASYDNERTFNTPINISNTAQNSFDPLLTTEGNNVYVVWREEVTLENNEIFFTSSNNDGRTFSSPDNLSDNDVDSLEPQISSKGNNVYVVWYDVITPGNGEIFFRASNNNGQTFSDPPDNLIISSENSRDPQISSEANNVYVVWQDNTPNNDVDIFFTASNNNGQTFSDPPDNLSNTTSSSFDPKISSEGNNVYIIWEENLENVDVFFIASNRLQQY